MDRASRCAAGRTRWALWLEISSASWAAEAGSDQSYERTSGGWNPPGLDRGDVARRAALDPLADRRDQRGRSRPVGPADHCELCMAGPHRVPKDPEAPASEQQGSHLCGSDRRVQPMPGLAADHQVEIPSGGIPLLEPGHFHSEAVGDRHIGHAGVGLDADDVGTSGRKKAPDLAGAATDVEHGRPISVRQEVIDQLRWILWTRSVIELSSGAEDTGTAVPVLGRHVPYPLSSVSAHHLRI